MLQQCSHDVNMASKDSINPRMIHLDCVAEPRL